MGDPYNLQRFLDAQDEAFARVLDELRAGSKRTHWIWFIFPQLAGLGRSPTARYYGLSSLDEGRAYLAHPLLGARLGECLDALLPWGGKRNAEQILGGVDALKLRSCLTLFDQVEPSSLFAQGLAAFYHGDRDERTLALLIAGA